MSRSDSCAADVVRTGAHEGARAGHTAGVLAALVALAALAGCGAPVPGGAVPTTNCNPISGSCGGGSTS